MSIRVGITGHTGSLGGEIIKSKFGYDYSFFNGDIRNKNKISKWIKSKKALDASDPMILASKIGPNETHLYKIDDQHGNWLDCIQSRKAPISPVDIGHKACVVCLISHIAMKIPRRLEWDSKKEKFINDNEANSLLSRNQRKPYGTNNLKA